jgi:putative SOS response-associated peptidase YedK
MVRWGLVPFWADDLSIGNRLINARCETVHTLRALREAYSRRRCLVPADGASSVGR